MGEVVDLNAYRCVKSTAFFIEKVMGLKLSPFQLLIFGEMARVEKRESGAKEDMSASSE